MPPPPLVLLHGVGTSRKVWRRVLPLLGARRRTIAVDLPGFGDASPAGPGFELDDVAEVVTEAALERAGGRFDLLGHSLGGAVAVHVARRRPEAIDRLVLLAPAGFTPRSPSVAAAVGTAGEALLAARRAIGVPLAANATARRVLLWSAVHDGARMSPEDARFMLEASRRARRLRPAIEAVLSEDLTPVLAELRGPLGLLRGEHDRVVSEATIEALAAARPDAVVRTLPDCGHVPQLERPDELAAAVEAVLDALPKAPNSAP